MEDWGGWWDSLPSRSTDQDKDGDGGHGVVSGEGKPRHKTPSSDEWKRQGPSQEAEVCFGEGVSQDRRILRGSLKGVSGTRPVDRG